MSMQLSSNETKKTMNESEGQAPLDSTRRSQSRFGRPGGHKPSQSLSSAGDADNETKEEKKSSIENDETKGKAPDLSEINEMLGSSSEGTSLIAKSVRSAIYFPPPLESKIIVNSSQPGQIDYHNRSIAVIKKRWADGIAFPKRPIISSRNTAKMEERQYREGGDIEVYSIPSVKHRTHLSKPFKDKTPANLQIRRSVPDMSIVEGDKTATLLLRFTKIVFRDHAQTLPHLTSRMESLINLGIQHDGEMPSNVPVLSKSKIALQQEQSRDMRILFVVSKWCSVVEEYRKSAAQCYNLWQKLKQIRKENGYSNSRIKLTAKKVLLFDEEKVKKQLSYIDRIIHRDYLNDSKNEQIKTQTKQKRYWINMLERARKLVALDGNDYLFTLKNSNLVSPVSLPAVTLKEELRRKSIENLRIYTILRINGHQVCKTDPMPFDWPSFAMNISPHQTLHIELYQLPEKVELQIFQKNKVDSMTGNLLGTMNIELPGSSTHCPTMLSVAPISNKGFFKSANPMISKFIANDIQKPEKDKKSKSNDLKKRYFYGNVDYEIAWDTSDALVEPGAKPCILPAQPLPSGKSGGLSINGKILVGPKQALRALSKKESMKEQIDVNIDKDFKDESRRSSNTETNAAELATSWCLELGESEQAAFQTLVNPNDPRNQEFMRLKANNILQEKRIFRVTTLESELNLSTYIASGASRRHQLLRLREKEPIHFMQPVPSTEKEVASSNTMLSILKGAEEREAEIRAMSGRKAATKKQRIGNFLRRVKEVYREQIQKSAIHKTTLDEIVREELLPDFAASLDFGNIVKFFEPRRRLKPQPRARQPSSTLVPECKIHVQIVRAQNVPIRASYSKLKYSGSTGDGSDGDRVMSFVDVRFQNHQHRTSAHEGPAPIWNETRQVPITLPFQDISAKRLIQIRDEVHFLLFDELRPDESTKRRRSGRSDQTQRYERRFLGSFSLPFSTIYLNGRIRGNFRLNAPISMLGYDRYTGPNAITGLPTPGGAPTYLTILATLDPPVAVPPNIWKAPIPYIPNDVDLLKLHQHAMSWKKKITKQYPVMSDRELEVLVPDLTGHEQLITRYIRPQEPPPALAGNVTMSRVAEIVRFVSVIPFLNDWHVDGDKNDIWCTSEQFLNLQAGDWEEHAILLCNYFLYLDKKAGRSDADARTYLLLGHGVPMGDCCMVLRYTSHDEIHDADANWRVDNDKANAKKAAVKKNKETAGQNIDEDKLQTATDMIKHDAKLPVIWDACSGNCYSPLDLNCPLVKVGCVVNANNVWANIQTNEEPKRMNWNLDDTKCWSACFQSDAASKVKSLQKERLEYTKTPSTYTAELEAQIDQEILRAIRGWRRNRFTTDFNRSVSLKLKELLRPLENVKLGLNEYDIEHHVNQLKRLNHTFDIFGFPINVTFIEMKKLLAAVKNTDIHENEIKGVQFAIASLVQSYTNHVCSVWLYIAALIPVR